MKEAPMKETACGIVPIWRQPEGDRFLLIQHLAGHWGFPKGHAEAGESTQATAQRELEEETGIHDYTLLDACFEEQYFFTRNQHTVTKTVIYFPAFVYTPTVICQAQEVQDYAWVSYEEGLEKITFDQARQILTNVYQYLQNRSGEE